MKASTKSITITGNDIIGTDGKDHTGALVELGVPFVARSDGFLDPEINNREFDVDLDFVLRHGLIDARIYESHYKGSEEFNRYYNEGKAAFLAGKEGGPNPYDTGTIHDEGYWNTSIYHRRYPWYDGYRETQLAFYTNKYKLDAFQQEIKDVISKYGLTLDYEDEYGHPYVKTPEGYTLQLA